MAKQTIKQRKAIRSAAAKKPRPVKPGYPEGYGDGWQACLRLQAMEAGREMVAADLMQPPPPPLCRDCRFSGTELSYMRCTAPIDPDLSLTTGAIKFAWDSAEVNRKYEFLCGREGRYFEPRREPPQEPLADAKISVRCTLGPSRPSLWQRIKRWFA